MPTRPRTPPRLVALFGYGGLVPFLALAALAWLDPARQARWSGALLDYGAVILAFVGALHWALAMQADALAPRRRAQAYAWSVVPALIAWGALQLAPGPAALLLVAGFLLHFVADHALAARLPLPPWYLPLRARLTAVASACLVALAWSGVG